MTGICGHIPGVTCSNCRPAPSRAVRDANYEAQVRGVLGMGGDLRAEAERMPEVSLEWDVNDEDPPCIDFTCVCGYWKHLCHGPDWITEGRGQAPGVKCDKCGTAWSLYRVQIAARIREEAEPDPLDESDHRDFVDAVRDANNRAEFRRQLREVLEGAGRWSGWVRQDNPDPLEEDDHRARLGGSGRWQRRASLWCHESCPCYEGNWTLDQIDGFDGPLTFAPKPAQEAHPLPDTPSGQAFTARDKEATDAARAKTDTLGEWLAVMKKYESEDPRP